MLLLCQSVNVVLAVVQVVYNERHEVAEAGCDEGVQSDIAHLLQNVTDECQVHLLTYLLS